MNVIPFNVPGLPEPDELSSRFVFKPVAVDTSDPHAGLRVAHRPGVRAAPAHNWYGDGVMCIYPEIETVGYLFNASLRTQHHEAVPALVVTTQSTDGLCAIFGFGGGYGDVPPQLIVELLPDECLPSILRHERDSTFIDIGRINERVEITQTFASNSFGVVSRVNELTPTPKAGTPRRGSEPIFNFYDDVGSIADISSFYFSRAMHQYDMCRARTGAVETMGGPESIWQLLWKPTSFLCVAAFSTVYILTQLSISVRRARGETSFSLDYNRRANGPDRNSGNE
jgi:hypothetical protein